MIPAAQFRAVDSAPRIDAERARRQVASRMDYLWTYGTTGLTLTFALLAFRLAHSQLGETGFAEFALMRRVTAFLVPLLSIGLAVSIAKNVARHAAENRDADSKDYLAAGVLLGTITVAAFSMAVTLFPRNLSFLCTGLYDRAELLRASIPLVAGTIFMVCGSAYFRGRMWFHASNVLQFVCLGIVPVAVLMETSTVESFLCWSGLAVCAVSGLAIVGAYLSIRTEQCPAPRVAARSLLCGGLPRLPGDLAYYGLLAAPAVAAAHFAGVRVGGDVAYALAWLTMLSQLVTPISALQLPEAARLIHSGQTQLLRQRLQRQLRVTVPITCVLVAGLCFWRAEVIELHLGQSSAAQLAIVRLLLAAAIPLNVFICLRSVIDAGESSAVCPGICLIAFAGFCLGVWVLAPWLKASLSVSLAFVFATSLLATLAIAAVRRTLNRHDRVVVRSASAALAVAA